MGAKIYDKGLGAFKDAETPLVHNKESQAWEESTGLVWDDGAQAWEERWGPCEFTVVQSVYDGGNYVLRDGDDFTLRAEIAARGCNAVAACFKIRGQHGKFCFTPVSGRAANGGLNYVGFLAVVSSDISTIAAVLAGNWTYKASQGDRADLNTVVYGKQVEIDVGAHRGSHVCLTLHSSGNDYVGWAEACYENVHFE